MCGDTGPFAGTKKPRSTPADSVWQLPNLITLIRLFASPFVAWLLIRKEFGPALGLVLLAGLTDWLDGYTARRLHMPSQIGVILDPLADKVMMVTLFLTLSYIGLVPLWLLGLAVGRDLVIVLGALLLRAFRNIRKFLPSMLGKVSTFFQIVFVLLTLIHAVFPFRPMFWLWNIALALTTLFTVLSGIDYVRRGVAMSCGRPA